MQNTAHYNQDIFFNRIILSRKTAAVLVYNVQFLADLFNSFNRNIILTYYFNESKYAACHLPVKCCPLLSFVYF